MNKDSVSGYKLIFGYLGLFMMVLGIIILLPLLTIIFFPEELDNAKYFIVPGVSSIILGYFIHFYVLGKSKEKLEKYQDAILVLFIWIIAILISSIPFLLTGEYNFTQSIFETTSGYSTTGLSVVDVTKTPKVFLMYRSLLQFIGGVGLVLILTSAISDRYGMRLYSAEGHSDKLLPNLARSARLILSIYTVYIIIGTILYRVFGMTFFDGLNHSIAAVSTGGFSTKANSIAFYNSPSIEIITIVLMFLGNTNFVVHLFLIKGKLKNVIKHIELKFLGIISLIFIPIMVVFVASNYQGNFWDAFRIGLFQFVSGITTTGFQSVDSLLTLPNIVIFCIIILMIIGGGIGSTAGGIKQYRVALAIKNFYWNFKDRVTHKNVLRSNYINKFGKVIEVKKQDLIDTNSHITIYLLTLIIGTLIFTAYGHSLQNSLFEFASALGTVGLSVGIISYNSPPLILWTTSFGMFMGRLEFYVVFVAFAKIFMDISKRKVL